MSKFGALNLDEKETALNWTKRLEGVCECSDLPNKDVFETGRITETKIGHPLRIGLGQFPNFKGVFGRVVRSLFACAIYTIKLYRVDLAGIWKSETQRQLIWSSVNSRIMGETK